MADCNGDITGDSFYSVKKIYPSLENTPRNANTLLTGLKEVEVKCHWQYDERIEQTPTTLTSFQQIERNFKICDQKSINSSATTKFGLNLQAMKEKLNLSLDINTSRPLSVDSGFLENTRDSFDNSGADLESLFEYSQESPTRRGFEEFYKHFRSKKIQKEFDFVKTHSQDGVYLTPSVKSLQLWFGVMFIKNGPYKDGIFHFTIHFDDDFPETLPTLKFKSKVFHPQIDPKNGTINLSLFRKQQCRGPVHTWELIQFARSCFYHLTVDDATNNEAAQLFLSDLTLYWRQCKATVLKSLLVFEEQKHGCELDSDNPFRCLILDTRLTKGIKKIILEKGKNDGIYGSVLEWAKLQVERLLNNITENK